MKAETVRFGLLASGVDPRRIVQKFTSSGLAIGLILGPVVGRRRILWGLVPIDDESDEQFADWL